MPQTLPTSRIGFLSLLLMLFTTYLVDAQTTVFADDFAISTGTVYSTTTGPIGTSTKWNLSRGGSDFGSRITNGLLTLTNDSGGSANVSGWAIAGANTSTFATPYNTTLGSNPGMITWTFNMRQIRSNPNGFASGNYGAAFILAGTTGTTNVSGTGYAVTIGGTGKIDPIRLVRYTAGVRTATSILSSTTTGLTDFGTQYLSIKVTYTPSTNTWQLYVRNDGTTAFQDPAVGTLSSQGTAVSNTYTTTPLGIIGGYWNAGTNGAQTAFFDNVKVTVAVPAITSITPPSKIAGTGAFTLTVNGSNFVNGISSIRWNGLARTTTFVSATQLTAAIPATDITSAGTAAITVANGAAISNTQIFTIDAPLVPSLAVSTTALAAQNTVTGTPSAPLSYTISGTDLGDNAILTAPANFEISTTSGSGYAGALSLGRTGTALTGQPVTIYSRIKASAPAGIYSGDITNVSTGATSKLVAMSGTVLAAQPVTNGSGITFTSVTSASFTINWTNGPGTNRLVVVRAGNAVNSVPVDGISYSAVATFPLGSELGTGNFVVYNGTANSVNVTGLSPNSNYHVAIYDFNGGSGTENYLTTSPPVGNRTTLNAPVGWQIFAANTINTINFDTTVDGVNLDAFQGDGLSSTSQTGELNSNAWAISGFSDGAVAFTGNSADDSDFDRGTSEGNVIDGGVYAFETAPDNFSLGFQPATGDFAPGSATLRFQNQTGSTVTSVSIAYKIYVYNDEAAATNFNFAHSADNNTFTTVNGLITTTPATADIDPNWKAYYRVVTLTGLNITNNNYYYLRWNATVASGSVAFDEIAIDDIQLVVNPTTNFVSVSGSAADLVLLGNATLAGNTTVNGNVTFASGKLTLNGQTLILGSTVTNTVTGALKGSAASSISVTGTGSPTLSFDQTTPGTTNLLNNLTIATSTASTVTIANPIIINGALSINTNQTLNLGTNALTGTLTSILGAGIITTQNTSALPLQANKTWSGHVNYNAATPQTVVAGTYNNLTITNPSGAVAAEALTVNGILNLPHSNPNATTGSLSMGAYALTMGATSSNSGIGDVTGVITRNAIVANTLYTFGHADTSIIFPAAGTLPTTMSLKINIGSAPSWRTGAIKRTYDFIQSGAASTKAVIKAHYLDSELNGNVESKLVDWAYIVSSSTTLEQGRSNYNVVENWVELTNVNVGLYFAPVFGAVQLTLDESEAGSLTWNGSVSTSWTTATNWTPNATPSDATMVYIPDAATTPNDPVLNPAVLLGSLTIDVGGILSAPADSQFTVNGAAGAWINNGTFTAASGSSVIFTNADATIAGTTTFNNLTINSGASLRPVSNNHIRIANTFINNGIFLSAVLENTVEYIGNAQVIAQPNSTIGAYYSLIISGTAANFPSSLSVRGDLTLNQPVDFTGKTIAMVGTTPQVISGTSSLQFGNLTINNTSGTVNMMTNAAVLGTLNLTAGNLNIGSSTLTLGTNPVVGAFDSTHMIVVSGTGEVRRPFSAAGSYLFPIGEATGALQYSPLSINITSGTFSNASVGVSLTDAIHPNNSSLTRNISRYWKVNQSGITNAVATVAATYIPVDLTGPENELAMAQLNGTFNQQTNPWTKFGIASGNTLTAASAVLPSNENVYFTGIKGAAFSAQISGFGSFCQNEPVTLTAATINGDGPFSYSWSGGLGTGETATPQSATAGTTNYTVTVKDSNGITVTDSASVIILTPTLSGTLSGNQFICTGTAPADIILTGYNGTILYWQSATDAAFTTPTNISNITATLSGAQIGTMNSTLYFRAIVQNGTCSEVVSAPIAVNIRSTTWNGISWSNGAPDGTITAIISGNYTATADLNACSLTVDNNALVNIPSGFDVNLFGALTVNSGSFTLQNNANLLQSTSAANTGNIIVKRNSSALKRLDYTLWSSPVQAQNMLAFSPLTSVTPSSRFYNYNTATHLFNSIDSPSTTTFTPGAGNLIRMPNNHPTTPTIWNGQFTGVPNNGNHTFTITGTGELINLVGNPYPSPISAAAFVADNASAITGALYFWRKTNSSSTPTYCSWTSIGGFVDNGEAETTDLAGIIQTGQGFFVEGSSVSSVVTFKNSQRSGNNSGQFFRTSEEIEKNRIWLNVTGDNGAFAQMLVGYFTGATLDVDQNIDARYINEGPLMLTSKINNVNYIIDGRPLPFDGSDVVPLNFVTANPGTFTLAIDHLDGFFSEDQDIYLRDNTNGTVHDLKNSGYTFTTLAGTFGSRFDILYQSALATENPALAENEVVVTSKQGTISINSGTSTIDNVEIFDIRGRLLAQKSGVNASETAIAIEAAQQILIVKITTVTDQTVVRKILHN